MKGPALCFRRRVTESRRFAASQLSRKHRYIQKIQNKYLYTCTYKKTVPVLSSLIWISLVLLQSDTKLETWVLHCAIQQPRCYTGSPPRNNNAEGTKSIRPPLPTRRDPIQSNWITSLSGMSLSQQWGATLGRKMLLRSVLDHYF